MADLSVRAEGLQAALDEARAAARQEADAAGELRRRVVLLEEELEGARLQHATALAAAVAAGAGVAGAAAAGAGSGGAANAAQVARLESDLAERRRAAEERAAQLDALGR